MSRSVTRTVFSDFQQNVTLAFFEQGTEFVRLIRQHVRRDT